VSEPVTAEAAAREFRITKAAFSELHVFSAKGGPSSASIKLSLDGRPLIGVTKFQLEADVKDIIRLKLELFVKADIDLSVSEEGLSTDVRLLNAGTSVRDQNP
jgi:hypothetical protein